MIIVITHPEYFAGEADIINRMFCLGLQRLHLRKPTGTAAQLEQLIQQIDTQYHNRLVLHDHHTLALKYALGGIHLNSRNPLPLPGFDGTVSCSCHSFGELETNPHHCAYRTLSPIYNSISKQNYNAAFTPQQLAAAAQSGSINRTVYALGGITLNRIPQIAGYGFGGALLLGEPWQMAQADQLEHYIPQLLSLTPLFNRHS